MASESRSNKKAVRILDSPSSGFCYSNSTDNNLVVMNQIQGFDENNQGDQQLFNLTTGIELLAFPSKNINTSSSSSSTPMWKSFFNTNKQATNSITITNPNPSTTTGSSIVPTTDFYQTSLIHHDHHTTSSHDHEINLLVSQQPISSSSSSWQQNDSSLHQYHHHHVFPSHQGLSLSLSSNKPPNNTSITELIQPFDNHQQDQDGYFGKSINFQQQNQIMQDHNHQMQTHCLEVKNSKYLIPTQELLNEFCSNGSKESTDHYKVQRQKNQKINQLEDENGSGSSMKQSFLYSTLDLLELQKRKTKLISILEQVDKRYRLYCDQMKAVVASFEAVVGYGAASGYSALASKAMSKHFRCLRDGVVEQIKAIKKAMGEKDIVAPGTTKGETPRLRLLDQTLRQQRAVQQMSMMESHPWRPQRGLPERSVSVLRSWLFEHFLHPYPSEVDKHILARQAGLSRSQVSNWFINARVRLWKPMVEEMYLEETKEQNNAIASSSDWVAVGSLDDNNRLLNQDNLSQLHHEDQKPTSDQLAHGDTETLSSIINIPTKLDQNYQHYNHHEEEDQQQRRLQFERLPENENFGATNLDFSSYNNAAGSLDHHQSNLGNGISLTLGLQQHGGSGGMSLSFSPVSQQSLFFPRDQMGDCDEQVQYSILDGEAQNFPYRNLMEAQLLNDLSG